MKAVERKPEDESAVRQAAPADRLPEAANQDTASQEEDSNALTSIADRWTAALESIKQQNLEIRKLRDEAKAHGIESGALQQVISLSHNNPADSGKEQLELMVGYAQQLGIDLDGLSQAQLAEVIQLFGDNRTAQAPRPAHNTELPETILGSGKIPWGLIFRLAAGIGIAVLAIKFI